ncbi:hypothetical protein ACRRTK_024650 [Alexandromys fortis]
MSYFVILLIFLRSGGTGCFETDSHHVDHTGLVEIHLALPQSAEIKDIYHHAQLISCGTLGMDVRLNCSYPNPTPVERMELERTGKLSRSQENWNLNPLEGTKQRLFKPSLLSTIGFCNFLTLNKLNSLIFHFFSKNKVKLVIILRIAPTK